MTQILRPSTEITNDGFLYDPVQHPSSVSISPAGARFPYTKSGYTYDERTSPFGLTGEIVDPWVTTPNTQSSFLIQQYHTGYKAISAPAHTQGTAVKTVTYGGFAAKTDAWTTGTLTVICGANVLDTLKTDDIDPTVLAEYSKDGGSTWTKIFELTWNTTSRLVSGGIYWKDVTETLGPNTIVKQGTGLKTVENNLTNLASGVLPVWWGITEGNEYATTITGFTDATLLKVRFTISGGHITPVGYPYTANRAPYFVGSGLMLADINITDPSYTAPPPNTTPTGATGTTGPVNANVIKTGPGAPGQTDVKWQVATMTGETVTGSWVPAKVMTPHKVWATISGTNWINAGDGPTDPSGASGPVPTPIGTPNTRYRYKTTFNLPANFASASLALALYCDDSSPRIALNGNVIGTQANTDGTSGVNFTAPPHSYSASTGFVAGTNVLEIDVKNAPTWTGLNVLGQIDYQTSSATGSGGGGSGITTDDFDTPIVSIGGTPGYTYSIVNDSQTTLPLTACSINADKLRVNGSGVAAGLYTVHLRVTDSVGGTDDQVVTVKIHDNTKFNIINESISVAPNTFPYSGAVTLQQYGGSGSVTWSIMPGTTTLSTATIDGNQLKYTINNFGSYQIGILATDSLGKTVSKVIGILFTTNSAYKLVDGQIELQYVDSSNVPAGSHRFNFGLQDSKATSTARVYNYLLNPAPSPIASKQYSVNKYWSTSESTTYNLPISGSQSGVVLGDAAPVALPNGLTVSVNGTTKMAQIQGRPTTAVNSLAEVSVPMLRAGVSIGKVHRSYAVVPYAGSNLTNLGTNTVLTVPALVGDFFTLNPQKPYFNSPDNSRDITWKARVKSTSALPKGISLDKNTGLLYGPVVDAGTSTGVIEFVDPLGNVKGTFSVNFNFLAGDFTLIESLPTGKLSTAFTGQIHSSSTDALTKGEVIYGVLPAGLTISASGNGLNVTGTPTEAGYFDFWIKATNTIGKVGYIYKRMEVGFVTPLSIVTTSLPNVLTGVAYSAQMSAVGGTGRYTWTKTGAFPTSITMTSGGLISGTTADASYSQSITFTVTDSAGATASVAIPLSISNSLTILTTSPIPNATRNLPYSYTLSGTGGTGTGYVWTLDGTSPALPSGLSLATSGVISGTTAATPTSIDLVVKLTDSSTASVTKLLNLTVLAASPTLGVGQAGIESIRRGCTYQGVLRVTGTGVAPYSWKVSPTSANPLPSGILLTANANDQGATAYLSGSTTAVLDNVSVKIDLQDASGALVSGFIPLTTVPSVEINTASLPQGKVGVNYSVTLSGQSCNTPYTWSLDGSSPALPSGFSLNSSGFLTGNTASPYNQNIKVKLTDSIGDSTTKVFSLQVVSSNLQITTNSIPEIPSGQPWSFDLTATGGTGTGYVWTCADPASGGQGASGWQVDVAATGAWGDLTPWASGTYTVTASGGSGSYTGTGTFNWSNKNVIYGVSGETAALVKQVYYGYPTTVSVTDNGTGQTISGNLNIPFSLSPGDVFPRTITWNQTFRNTTSLAAVLPTNVLLSSGGTLYTSGTTATFDQDVLFTVTDSAGASASKVLRVKVAQNIVIPVGTLTTGIDRANSTQTGYLGAVGLYPGDIGVIAPRPNKSFYVYGSMAGASASQLNVTVTTNSGTGYYTNIQPANVTVDSSGVVTIQLVFAPDNTGVIGGSHSVTNGAPSAQNNVVDVVLTNTANGLTAKGSFFFDTVDYGELSIVQGDPGRSLLPTFTISPSVMN